MLDPKQTIRRIFEGQVEFEENELESLRQFDAFLQRSNFQDFDKWTEPMKLRMLYATKFKFEKSLAIMNTYMAWRQKSLPP